MLDTVETRWFGQGSIPKDVQDWFSIQDGEPERQPLRRDYYLQPVDDLGLSIKLREGGMEVKQRQGKGELIRLGPSIEGLVEHWTKWRFPVLETSNALQSISDAKRNWVAIDKHRLLKHYQVDGPTAVWPVTIPEAVDAPCHVELAEVWFGRSCWWTVGCEVEGDDSGALERLLAIAGLLFRDAAPTNVSRHNSFGYPHWLAMHDYQDET